MECGGYKIYHVRGHYYTIFHPSYSDPAHLGREILAEVPIDRAEYQEWKRFTISFYKREEKRIQQIAKEAERYIATDESEEMNDFTTLVIWGRNYDSKPSRTINFKRYFTWTYIVDLDTDRFLVIKKGDFFLDQTTVQRRFRLDNIPRLLFDPPLSEIDLRLSFETHPLVLAEVADEYKPLFLHKPLHPDQALPGPNASYTIKQISSTFEHPRDSFETPRDLVWRSLRLLLLRQLIHRYQYTNESLDNYRTQADSVFLHRQMIYAMVSIAHGDSIIRFRERTQRYEDRIGHRNDATPWWEPPDTDNYWMGEVLIMLDDGMNYHKDLRAMIEKAIHLTEARGNTTTIIFSGQEIATAHISHENDGIIVSKASGNLWLSSSRPGPCCTCCCAKEPTPAFLALLHTLYTPQEPCIPLSYPSLPNEICENIYNYANRETQNALRMSCRLFNEIGHRSYQYPQVGEWKLMKSGYCPSRYSAALAPNIPLQNVDVKASSISHGIGYEFGILTKRSVLELGISLFGVEISEDEECCRNYPEDPGDQDDVGWGADEIYLSGRVVGLRGPVEQRDGGRRPFESSGLKICND